MDESFIPVSSLPADSISWSGLASRYTEDFVAGRSLMIDDLEAFELLAPNAKEAKQFLSHHIREMQNQVVPEIEQLTCVVTKRSAQTDHAWASIAAFGRMPLETISQLPMLGETEQPRYRPPSNHGTAGSSAKYNCPLDENNQPTLSEYLRYRCVTLYR